MSQSEIHAAPAMEAKEGKEAASVHSARSSEGVRDPEKTGGRQDGLKRKLKSRQLQMIAMGMSSFWYDDVRTC